jgi:hypothetical protein
MTWLKPICGQLVLKRVNRDALDPLPGGTNAFDGGPIRDPR